MNQIISKFLKYSLLSSIVLTILAILFIVQSAITIVVIAYVLGAILIALGVQAEMEFVKGIYKGKLNLSLIYGIVCVILGIIVISYPEAIEEMIALVIGFIMIVCSAIKIQYSLELRKDNNKKWLPLILISIATTICGVVLTINPFQGFEMFLRIIGYFVLGYAVLDLLTTIYLLIVSKKVKSNVNTNIKEATIIEDEVEKKDSKKRLGD